MSLKNLDKYTIILASQSPRRKQLLGDLGVDFEVRTKEGIEEVYPDDLSVEKIPAFLSELKANAFKSEILENDLLITSDTIVSINNQVLGKPNDRQEAINMIKMLSGKKHNVISGVHIYTSNKQSTLIETTQVYFKNLTQQEIEYYVDNFQPYDKAGAYGIQEWIGYIGIEKIEGSYFNVMGLPVQKLYKELLNY